MMLSHCYDNLIAGKSCPTLEYIGNGILSALSGKYEDKVTLQCNSGYMLDGVHTVTCEGSGKWTAQIGKCILQKSDLNKSELKLLIANSTYTSKGDL